MFSYTITNYALGDQNLKNSENFEQIKVEIRKCKFLKIIIFLFVDSL